MYDIEVQEVIDKLIVFEKMYDVMRIVDPVNKKIIKLDNIDNISDVRINCFEFWGKTKACNNCISIRAYNENQTFIKIEYTQKKIFMVTAIPFELEERRIVIEMLKDTTNSFIFQKSQVLLLSGGWPKKKSKLPLNGPTTYMLMIKN